MTKEDQVREDIAAVGQYLGDGVGCPSEDCGCVASAFRRLKKYIEMGIQTENTFDEACKALEVMHVRGVKIDSVVLDELSDIPKELTGSKLGPTPKDYWK